MVCISPQLCTHDGNSILVLMESICNREIGKFSPSGSSFPRLAVKQLAAHHSEHLALECCLLQDLLLSRSPDLILLEKLSIHWIGPSCTALEILWVPFILQLLLLGPVPCDADQLHAGAADSALGPARTRPSPAVSPTCVQGKPSSYTRSPGGLVPVGPPD